MKYINDDIDYIWNLDSDEIYTTEDLHKIVKMLETEKPTSVGIRSCSFYGDLDHYLTGFELAKDNFLRIFKYEKRFYIGRHIDLNDIVSEGYEYYKEAYR